MIKILDCKSSNYLSRLKQILEKRRDVSKINTNIVWRVTGTGGIGILIFADKLTITKPIKITRIFFTWLFNDLIKYNSCMIVLLDVKYFFTFKY